MPQDVSTVLAIDPGTKATACVFRPGRSVRSGMRWQFLEVPQIALGENSVIRVDAVALREFVMKTSPDHCFVELVNPMAKQVRGRDQGIASTGKFMRAAGACEAVLATCMGVYPTLITPQRWKKYHGIKSTSDDDNIKELSRLLAMQKYPELTEHLPHKNDHGLAEAALLAAYGAYLTKPI